MRGSLLLAVILAGSLARGSSAAAERGWVVQAGGGSIEPSERSSLRPGTTASLAVAHVTRPWLLIGGEFGWTGTPGAEGASTPEVRVTRDDTRAYSMSAVVRLQVPVRVGPAPFAVFESGFTRLRWGASHYDGSNSGFLYVNGVTPGEVQWGSRAAVGAGLRVVLPGAWPDPEASARAVTLGLQRQANFAEYRYSLVW